MAKIETRTEAQQIADLMHETRCHYNHVEHCGYFYSTWDNPNWDRRQWLEKAEKILKLIEFDVAVKVALI